eukprot:15439108-Alexandrium_andersonii.AAC.1
MPKGCSTVFLTCLSAAIRLSGRAGTQQAALKASARAASPGKRSSICAVCLEKSAFSCHGLIPFLSSRAHALR